MIEPAPGILLIADPFLKDPNFLRSVVFLCEHKEEGSLGFVINRKYDITLEELIPELEGCHVPVYYGGPVQLNTLHFLHQYADEIPGSQEISRGIYWGGDFDIVIQMLKNNLLDPNKIRFYVGYSGWASGQLEDELKENTWHTSKASKKLVFHNDPHEIWKESLRELGGDYELMVNFPIDPQLN
ncbi:MAG: YqgE/AlgH family protein [Chitinophagaceae bacterium]|nr:YqgE/AlgH family protein [Chitinophagaceae bacterium]